MIQIPTDKKVILVTGSEGQLGKEFRRLANDQDLFEFLFTHRKTMDITNEEEVNTIFQKFRPDLCINCAAYTAVDLAETNEEEAFRINKFGIENLVKACGEFNSLLFNISSDYVYDSVTDRPLTESDICEPKSVYGRSKRAGERVLEQSNIIWLNFRTSWLYSAYGNNFVKSMIRLGESRDVLKIVADQVGAPTYAKDIASDIYKIIKQDILEEHRGHYNYCNIGKTTWADFAREIFRINQINCSVENISTEEFGAPAPRPKWSVMSIDKITSTFDLQVPHWKHSLKQCIEEINLQRQ